MHKVSEDQLAEKPKDGMVRIRILHHIGQFQPNETIECSEDEAKTLCRSTPVDVGGGQKDVKVRAIRMADFEDLSKKLSDPNFVTKDELAAMGKKNIVVTPTDPQYEKKLDKLRKMDQDWLEGKKTPAVGEEFSRKKSKAQKEQGDQVSSEGA